MRPRYRVEALERKLGGKDECVVLLKRDSETEEEALKRVENEKGIRLNPKRVVWLVID